MTEKRIKERRAAADRRTKELEMAVNLREDQRRKKERRKYFITPPKSCYDPQDYGSLVSDGKTRTSDISYII